MGSPPFPRVLLFLIALMLAQESSARSFGSSQKVIVKKVNFHSIERRHLPLGLELEEDPANHVFFDINDLQVDKKLQIFFAIKDPATSPRFLPRKAADAIPFSSSHLTHLLKIFSLSEGSAQAIAMKDTLSMCESNAASGETKFCATSLESMIDFAISSFRDGTKLSPLTNIPLSKQKKTFQNYTILAQPTAKKTTKVVGCHTMPYPYAIFYCHSQDSLVRVFQILLGGEDGNKMLAVGICHMDTSHWDPDHVSFRMLQLAPGSGPVCHFLQSDNIIWLPASS